MTLQLDAGRTAAEASRAAQLAESVRDHPGLLAAFQRLEQTYLAQFRMSDPNDAAARENVFFMLRALDALRQDIDNAINGSAITTHNLRSRLRR